MFANFKFVFWPKMFSEKPEMWLTSYNFSQKIFDAKNAFIYSKSDLKSLSTNSNMFKKRNKE